MNNMRSVQIQGNISVIDIHTNDLITSFNVCQTHANFSKKLACKEGRMANQVYSVHNRH